jgi:hypothetical protein
MDVALVLLLSCFNICMVYKIVTSLIEIVSSAKTKSVINK